MIPLAAQPRAVDPAGHHLPRGDSLILVGGGPGLGADRVHHTLLRWGLPFIRATDLGEPLVRPVTVTVLVDPARADWQLAESVGAPVVVCVTDGELSRVIEALLRGTRALLRAEDVGDELIPVLSLVSRGYVSLPAAHLVELSGWLGVRPATGPGGLPGLTAREKDILGSIAAGDSVRQTAQSLGIAVKTVENTQARMFRKLGVHNRPGALRLAYRLGLLEPHGV